MDFPLPFSLPAGATPLHRTYASTSQHDDDNLKQGICPDYALHWPFYHNDEYWPKNHDFLTPPNTYKASKPHYHVLRSVQQHIRDKNMRHVVFCDLDGVLADFDKGVYNLTGRLPHEIDSKRMWIHINHTPDFFSSLEWLPEGRRLWDALLSKGIEPIILTGTTSQKASEQKIEWCRRELGSHIRVICCKTNDKPLYCIHGSFLIDDRDKVKDEWIQNLGRYLQFTAENMEMIFKTIEDL